MNRVARLLKRIPYIKSKLARIRPGFEDILLHFFSNDTPLVFLDIGANVGQNINLIKKLYPNASIYSFEPTPDVFRDLRHRYADEKNVYLYEIALADRDGKLNFYASDFSATNSCLEPNKDLYNKLGSAIKDVISQTVSYEVNGMTLDHWCDLHLKNKPIDFVKIDTQGFEYNVIKGALKTLKNQVKIIYLEIQFLAFYNNSVPFYKIFELLYQNGFYLYCFLPSELRNKYQLLESDVVLVNEKFIKSYS